MSKKVKIGGGEKIVKEIVFEIGEKEYPVPLSGSLKRKEVLSLNNEESIFQFFARYIPEEVLDNLEVDSYRELAFAWIKANNESQEADLGES